MNWCHKQDKRQNRHDDSKSRNSSEPLSWGCGGCKFSPDKDQQQLYVFVGISFGKREGGDVKVELTDLLLQHSFAWKLKCLLGKEILVYNSRVFLLRQLRMDRQLRKHKKTGVSREKWYFKNSSSWHFVNKNFFKVETVFDMQSYNKLNRCFH